jgi:hypothetical protein
MAPKLAAGFDAQQYTRPRWQVHAFELLHRYISRQFHLRDDMLEVLA